MKTQEENIYVAIVDDDKKVRESISWLLESTEGFKCVGKYARCKEAVEGVEKDLPDVVLMDIEMPGQSGIEGVELLKEAYPDLKILMLTNYSDDERVFDSLRAGAVGYLLKNASVTQLCQAIKEAYSGGAPMSPEVAMKVLNYFHQQKKRTKYTTTLSKRELEVLQGLIDGMSDRDIAEKLFITVPTVRFHLKNVYAKLHVSSRFEAAMKAMREMTT
ncbi:response regulator transcription factor [bacterium]|nr:response regulator transcription factor [bacterium]